MRLLEYKGKEILAKYGVIVPKGIVVSNVGDIDKSSLKYPVFVKAQVPFAGRAKMGLVKRASNKDEAKQVASEYLGKVIQDFEVRKVLLEEGVDVVKEYYVSVTIDRSSRTFIILASPEGGVDIEEIARTSPEKIYRARIHPFEGLRDYTVNAINRFMGFTGDLASKFASLLRIMYNVFETYDAELVEINPLALTRDGNFVALDVKIMIDDNALYRHGDISVEEEGDLTREEL
ncbi:ATP-grasp domain-containing protein, partial [Caldivirga sp.]|uniref:ATP-grasp domain-containing protein n=1 Tax=Caldivirga sp. TaxID=2080243 RepID=UPI003D0C92B1